MKKLFFLLAMAQGTLFAQRSDSAITAGIATNILQKSRAYENLRFLCKQIGPRLSGSDNAQKAVEATARMLKEAGADTVYLQPCMVPHWVRGDKEQGTLFVNGNKTKDFNVCALGMSVGTPAEGIRAEVIEVKSFEQLAALGEAKVKGKIVFFNYAMRPELVFNGYGDAVRYRANGPIEAAKLGAVGVIVRSVTHALDNNPHTGSTYYADGVTKIPAMAISTLDAEYLSRLLSRPAVFGREGNMRSLNRNPAQDRPAVNKGRMTDSTGRVQMTKNGKDKTQVEQTPNTTQRDQTGRDLGAAVKKKEAAAAKSGADGAPRAGRPTIGGRPGGKVEFFMKMNCMQLPDAPSYNVIGELRGSGNSNEIITAGGHLDSWDLAEGAHDDGAGVVQAIEMIRAIKASGQQPKRTIRAVLFMNEENGSRGAEKYAEMAAANKEKQLFAIESDAGGFGCASLGLDGKPSQMEKVRKWLPLFKPYGILDMPDGGGGADIGPLKPSGTFMSSINPNSQRYFDVHHAPTDVFESVNKRELELGAIGMTLMCWLVSEYGL